MKELKIEIPSGHEIDKEKSTFEKIVFKKIEEKYPNSVKDIEGRSYYIGACGGIESLTDSTPNNMSTKERAEGVLALIQLMELKDAYNEIDGNKDFLKFEKRHIIYLDRLEVYDVVELKYKQPLQFKKESTAKLFLEKHRDLIETAKEFI